jgi:glucose/arabinose dehydrogenase
MSRARLACLLVGLFLHAAAQAPAQSEVYGTGCGTPTIGVTGSFIPGQKAQITLAGAPPGAFVYFLLGNSETSSVFGPLPLDLSVFAGFQPGCKLLTSASTQLLLNAGPQGGLKLSFKLPSSMGSDLHAQWAVVQSLSPLTVVMTGGAHISLQTNPDVHAEILGPAVAVDWDGNGTQAVPLDGSTSHTHEAGHTITGWKWKLDGQPAGSAPAIAPVVAAGPHVATLLVGDDGVPPDTALDTHAFSVVPPTAAPGVLARYYGSGAADPANLLDNEPLAADYSQVLSEALVPDNGGFVGGSSFTGQCMVTLDCNVTLPTAGTWTFSVQGGSQKRLFVDGVLVSGPKVFAAGSHAVEARYAVPGTAVLPLTILLAPAGGPAQPLDPAQLNYDATKPGPVINALTPPDGSIAGGNVVVIDGVGFFPAASTQVLWGSQTLGLADGLDIQAAQITFTTPAHAAGPIVVKVSTPAGTSNAASFDYTGGGSTVNFVKVTGVPVDQPTSAEWGSDGRLYVATMSGEIRALTFDESWNLTASSTYLGVSQLPNHQAMGLTVNPHDPPGPVNLYVAHGWLYADGGGVVVQPSKYWGQVSVLSGPNFDAPQPLVTGLPQPNTGHAVNGLQFDDNGDLLIAVGSTTNAGIAWITMGDLPESPLSAAVVKALTSEADFDGTVSYVSVPGGAPVADQRFGETSQLASGMDVLVQAAGLRNPYDLVYTTRHKLYATDNGPNASFGPASTGQDTQTVEHPDNPDELLLVESGNYYGSPNRARGLFEPRENIYRDPWGPSLPNELTQTLVTLPSSVDGITEYRADTFGGAMRGALVAQKWMGEARRITLSADGRSVVDVQTVLPATGALDIVVAPGGALVTIDYSNSEVEVLVPVEPPPTALQLLDIRPWRAPAGGGRPFVLGGRGFAGTLANTTVKIGGLPAAVTKVTSTRIEGLLPLQPAPSTSLLDVTVTSAGQSDTLPDAFRYLFEPAGNEPGVWELGGDQSGGGELPFALGDVATAALDGKLYVVGSVNPNTFVLDLLGSTELPLPFTTVAPRPLTGGGHSAEAVNGKLYLLGGAGASAGRVQIFSPVSGLWSLGANMPWSGTSVCTAVIGGRIYAAGGSVGLSTVDNLAVYDPILNQWTPLPPMPLHAGRNHAASGTDGQRLWIFGGYGFGNGDGGQLAPAFDTVQIYDPGTGLWQSSSGGTPGLPPLPLPRAGMGRAVWWQGEFYVFGGESSLLPGGGVTSRVDVYDPLEKAWRTEAPLPTARHGHGVALFQGRMFVLGGGQVGGAATAGKAVENFTRQ